MDKPIEVKIPFTPRFQSAVIEHEKWATSRTKRYGEVGNVFCVKESRYPYATFRLVITHQERVTLGFVAQEMYDAEGCESPEEFIEIWKKIHPRAGWTPEKKVWLHIFREV